MLRLVVVVLGIHRRDLVHVVQKILIGLILVHELNHEIHGLRSIHLCKQLPENPDALSLVRRVEKVITAGT